MLDEWVELGRRLKAVDPARFVLVVEIISTLVEAEELLASNDMASELKKLLPERTQGLNTKR